MGEIMRPWTVELAVYWFIGQTPVSATMKIAIPEAETEADAAWRASVRVHVLTEFRATTQLIGVSHD